MPTPTKEKIIDRSLKLYFSDNPISYNQPELDELKESGYYEQAQHELMQTRGPRAGGFPLLEESPVDTKYFRSNDYIIKRKEVNTCETSHDQVSIQ